MISRARVSSSRHLAGRRPTTGSRPYSRSCCRLHPAPRSQCRQTCRRWSHVRHWCRHSPRRPRNPTRIAGEHESSVTIFSSLLDGLSYPSSCWMSCSCAFQTPVRVFGIEYLIQSIRFEIDVVGDVKLVGGLRVWTSYLQLTSSSWDLRFEISGNRSLINGVSVLERGLRWASYGTNSFERREVRVWCQAIFIF